MCYLVRRSSYPDHLSESHDPAGARARLFDFVRRHHVRRLLRRDVRRALLVLDRLDDLRSTNIGEE